TRDAALEQRALATGIHYRGAEFAKVIDGALYDIDTFFIGLREKLFAHVFTNDADSHALQALRGGKAGIRLSRRASDTEYRHLVLGVVAGDHVEYLRGIFYRATDRAGPHVQTCAHHSVTADQLLGRSQANETVHGCRPPDRHDGFLADRARHEVCRHRRRRARTRHTGFAFGVVWITKRAAERTARPIHRVFGQV